MAEAKNGMMSSYDYMRDHPVPRFIIFAALGTMAAFGSVHQALHYEAGEAAATTYARTFASQGQETVNQALTLEIAAGKAKSVLISKGDLIEAVKMLALSQQQESDASVDNVVATNDANNENGWKDGAAGAALFTVSSIFLAIAAKWRQPPRKKLW
jgi:hypothetical protein